MQGQRLVAPLFFVPVLGIFAEPQRFLLRHSAASSALQLVPDSVIRLDRKVNSSLLATRPQLAPEVNSSLLAKPAKGKKGSKKKKDTRDPTHWKRESKGTRKIKKAMKKHAPWLTAQRRAIAYKAIAWGAILAFFGYLFNMFFWLFLGYRKVRAHISPEQTGQRSFNNYLTYRFSYWFAWTEGSRGVVLLVVTAVVLFSGAFVFMWFTGKTLIISTWTSFVWLVAPDAGAGQGTIAGTIIGACMSICGLVIFALLLTLLQDAFSSYVEKQGSAAVIDSDHTILIGLTDHTMPIIQELCAAHECDGGTTIVILSDQVSKEDMEEKMRENEIEFMGSRVVVRTGSPANRGDLEQVAADSARTIVVMADLAQTKEQRDAFALQVLVALRSEGWPSHGQIVAACSLVRNYSLFERIGGTNTSVVMLDRFTAKLMVQCSSQHGIANAVHNALGFDGSELYLKSVPSHTQGLTFEEASWFYPKAVLVGYMQEVGGQSEAIFCPSKDYKLNGKQDIILIAEDGASAHPEEKPLEVVPPPITQSQKAIASTSPRGAKQPRSLPHGQSMSSLRNHTEGPETIIIIGWNDIMYLLLRELNGCVSPGTSVHVLAPKSKDEREEYLELERRRNQDQWSRITSISHIEGPLGSRLALDDLQVITEASRIFILSDESAESVSHADTCTIASILQIRDIFLSKNQVANVPIIPEIMNDKLSDQCAAIRSFDFMHASGLPAQILAMIAYNPRIALALEQFLSDRGNVHFQIADLKTYCEEGHARPESLSFHEASALVRSSSDDVLLGWSKPQDETEVALNQAAGGNKGDFHQMMADWCKTVHPDMQALEWELNPADKSSSRPWTKGDKLLVLMTGPAFIGATLTAAPSGDNLSDQ